MFSLIFLAGFSFVICFFLTPVIRNFLNRRGILDRPDRERKFHERPIPRLGGVPILTAVLVSLTVFWFIPFSGTGILRAQWPMLLQLVPAAGLVFLIGVADDIWGLPPWQKLAGEVAAAAWIYVHGFQVHNVLGTGAGSSNWLSFSMTILWLVGCTNAFNLIDGMDGLASGVGFFATCTTFVAALLQGNGVTLGILTAPLAGALLAFLRFNFNPASMFLGDSGSLVIGFLLGAYGVLWSQKAATLLGMTAPVMALAFPILEAGISVSRRFLRGDPIFTADRGHIHHKLVDLGLTPRRTVLLIYGITAIFAAISLLVTIPQFRYSAVVIILFCAVSWIGVQHLGYAEFSEARKMFFGGTVQQLIASQTKLRSYRFALERADSILDCWALTVEAMRELGFDYTELALPDGRHYQATLQDYEAVPLDRCWTLRIPIAGPAGDGWLQLARRAGRTESYLMLQTVVATVREVFPVKLAEFEGAAEPAFRAAGPVSAGPGS